MSQLLKFREKANLTQQQLSEKSNISVRTIQRIEAGKELKGHTLEALAKALDIDKEKFIKTDSAENIEHIFLIKLINLSSLALIFIPLGSILVPLIIMHWKKQVNPITKQIVSLQILWTLLFPVIVLMVIFLGNLLPLSKQFVPLSMLVLLLLNVFMILRNTAALDKTKNLYFKLKFSII
ncbi:MAG: helix-turn-helix domain-containing protein [Cellulophaga sp.]|nr:helix-turn-helix domain-containing protein [Cellulophaga sp.]